MRVNFSVTNQLATPAIHAAPLAQQPAAGQPGRVFIDTDNPSTGIYRDTGTIWVNIAATSSPEADTLQSVTDRGNTTTQDIAIGTSSNPSAPLDVHGSDTIAIFQGTGTSNSFLQFNKSGSGKFKVGNVHNGGNDYFTVYNMSENSDAVLVNISTNNVAIGGHTVTPTYKVDIAGSLANTGAAYLGTSGGSSGFNTTSPDTTSVLTIQRGSKTENLWLTSSDGSNSIEFSNDAGNLRTGIYADTNGIGFGGGTSFRGAVFVGRTTNNVLINAGADAGYKLNTYGTALITGSTVIASGGGNLNVNNFTGTGVGAIRMKVDSGGYGLIVQGLTGTDTTQYNARGIVLPDGSGNNLTIESLGTSGTGRFASKIISFVANSIQAIFIPNTGNVIVGSTSDVATAILQATSTTKGFLPPRMTTAEKTAIANTAGLVVFDTDLDKLCVNSGTGWETITSV